MKHDDTSLWDPEVPASEELAELERLAQGAAWSGSLPDLPDLPAGSERGRLLRWAALAVAAGSLGAWFGMRAAAPDAAGLYRFEPQEGRVQLAGREIRELSVAKIGDALVTGPGGRGVLRIAGFGTLQLEPNTRLAVLDPRAPGDGRSERWSSSAEALLRLETGAVEALILARPGQFQVATPAGLSVDLGCAYRAEVLQDGSTQLDVLAGRVAFEGSGRRVTVHAGFSIHARALDGPTTPLRGVAPAALQGFVKRLDGGESLGEQEAAALARSAQDEDALTLVHLLIYPGVRAALLDRLEQTLRYPTGVTRTGCLAGDRDMIATWGARL